MTEVATNMRSVPILRRALEVLGVEVLEDVKQVTAWFGYENAAGANLEFAVGRREWHNHLGIKRSAAGTLSVVGDLWGIETGQYDVSHYAQGHAMLEALGYPSRRMEPKEEGCFASKIPARTLHWREEGGGHLQLGAPGRLLQEYTLQACTALARTRGQSVARIPSEGGIITLRITGGSLPPGKYVQVWTDRTGKCVIRPIGLPNPACHAATKPYEEMLGVIERSQEIREACEMGAAPTIHMRNR